MAEAVVVPGLPLQGAYLVGSAIIDAFNKPDPHAWEEPGQLIRILGLRITPDQFRTLSKPDRDVLRKQAKGVYLNALIDQMRAKKVRDARDAALRIGRARDLVEAFKFYEKGKRFPVDAGAVARVLARVGGPGLMPGPPPQESTLAKLSKKAAAARDLVLSQMAAREATHRAQAQQPAPPVLPDASTAGEIGASVHDAVAAWEAARAAEQQAKDLAQAVRRAGMAARGLGPRGSVLPRLGVGVPGAGQTVGICGGPGSAQCGVLPNPNENYAHTIIPGGSMSLADTLNTVLGTAAQAYGAYTNVQVAKANAKAGNLAAQLMQQPYIGNGGSIVPAVYDPGITSAAAISPSVLSAIQRFLQSGGSAALGAGLGAGVASLVPAAPMGGGGGAMILRPGDSVDSLYATRAASAAPSFFATQDASGRLKWYRSAGRPILWSGDLAAARRVSKVAARASRGRGRTRFLRRRR